MPAIFPALDGSAVITASVSAVFGLTTPWHGVDA